VWYRTASLASRNQKDLAVEIIEGKRFGGEEFPEINVTVTKLMEPTGVITYRQF